MTRKDSQYGVPVTAVQRRLLDRLASGPLRISHYPTRAAAADARVLHALMKVGLVDHASSVTAATYTLVSENDFHLRQAAAREAAAREAARTADDRVREILLIQVRAARSELRTRISIGRDLLDQALRDLDRDDSVNALGILQADGARIDTLAGSFMAYKDALVHLDQFFPLPVREGEEGEERAQ